MSQKSTHSSSIVESYFYLSSSKVFSILFFTGGRKKHNVVDGLDQLQLHHTFDQQRCKQAMLLDLCGTHECTFHESAHIRQDPHLCGVTLLLMGVLLLEPSSLIPEAELY